MRKIFVMLGLLLLTVGTTFAQDDELTPYDIALERILEAEQAGAFSLYLSYLGTSELPPEIGNLRHLRILILDDLPLHGLPPRIDNLDNLTDLSINLLGEEFSLPSEIGNLSNLEYLSISHAELQNLPPEIGNLHQLESLILNDTHLSNLPNEIGNLSNLEVLNLSNNQLSELPPEIGNLTSLTELKLDANTLSGLPPEIGNLAQLCSLDIASNQIQYLPSELGQASMLISEEPCGLSDSTLNISDNPLISPPLEVVEQGTEAILDYLNNQAQWHLQRSLIGLATGVGLLAFLFFVAVQYRQRGMRKAKPKRE